MFRNIGDLLSFVVLVILCIYAFRLLVWSFTYDNNQDVDKRSELLDMFKNYIDNEDE